jgi:hypothetical protein
LALVPGTNVITEEEWAAILATRSGKVFAEKKAIVGPEVTPVPAPEVPTTKSPKKGKQEDDIFKG